MEWGKFYWLVDGEGVKLPEQFNAAQVPGIVVGRDQKMNIRIIDGVRQPPPDTGRRWAGQDLAAGLGVAKLLYGKPFAEEIVTINVANFAGRVDQREAQIVFWTKYATQVRWGRPLDAKDFFAEVPANQKLSEMASIVKLNMGASTRDGRGSTFAMIKSRIPLPLQKSARQRRSIDNQFVTDLQAQSDRFENNFCAKMFRSIACALSQRTGDQSHLLGSLTTCLPRMAAALEQFARRVFGHSSIGAQKH